MSTTVGTVAWARDTRGALPARDRFAFARQAVYAQLADVPGRLLGMLGGRAGGRALELRTRPPDGRFAVASLALAESVYRPALLGHCLRTWLWSDLLAQCDGLRYDAEPLYVACLLHDIALTGAHRADSGCCFAVHGAEVAREHLLDRGAGGAFADQVAEAITLHMNPRVPVGLGMEAHLLHAGAHLDAAGTRAAAIPRPIARRVLARHPRDGFAAEFTRAMRAEARQRPASRAGLLWKLGMRLPLMHHPLDRVH